MLDSHKIRFREPIPLVSVKFGLNIDIVEEVEANAILFV